MEWGLDGKNNAGAKHKSIAFHHPSCMAQAPLISQFKEMLHNLIKDIPIYREMTIQSKLITAPSKVPAIQNI